MAREDLLDGGLSRVAAQGTLRQLRREQLVPAPWQPRRSFDRSALLALARSVRAEGVRQNLVVRPHPTRGGHYEIVAGERRWRASDPEVAASLALTPEEVASLEGEAPRTLPCLIVTLDDGEARRLSAVENLQRENLDPVDEASYRLLLVVDALGLDVGAGATTSKLAQEVGRRLHALRNAPDQFPEETAALRRLFEQLGTLTWESYTTNHLPLLQLPDDLLTAVREGRIAGRSALLIHRQADPALRAELLDRALAGASLKELTGVVDTHQGKAWRTLAAEVRGRLGARQLDRLDGARRTRVVGLLQQLQRELDGGPPEGEA
ncbi:ParB/RepB/Spo0J family partition protein [Deinococcus aestuarii]|uniref:ParB/RepB/Spo0J family partition protein n=1 Tax=Deinococcus aestuarii TaxID=2774531 RepID=UPI001C0CFEB7|nr:ParB N-terminal domain-containing protein [Deinococcus aestuarii]